MGGVSGWDGDAMGWLEDVLDSVQAFGRELIVAEGAEEFGNNDVDVAVAC